MKRATRKKYVEPNRDQLLLLPPDLGEWVPTDHFSRWLIEVVGKLELRTFYDYYEFVDGVEKGPAGLPPFDPRMMLTLMFYCMRKNAATSRRMEEMTYTDVGARFIAGTSVLPDHSSFAEFRKRHAEHMKEAFAQILLLCHSAGMVDLKTVAVDSTIIRSKAATHQCYDRNGETLKQEMEKCRAVSKCLLEKAETAEAEEQEQLRRKAARSERTARRLQDAIDFLKTPEAQAPQSSPELPASGKVLRDARRQANLTQQALSEKVGIKHRRLSDYERGHRRPSPATAQKLHDFFGEMLQWSVKQKQRAAKPAGKINLIDRDCYWTHRPNKGWVMGYMPQIAVDSTNQIIVAAAMAPRNDDTPYLEICAEQIKDRLGRYPDQMQSDGGYWAEKGKNVQALMTKGIDVLCPPRGGCAKSGPNTPEFTRKMRERLDSPEGKAEYKHRSSIVEPVNGRLQALMQTPRFLTKGLRSVAGEWFGWAGLHNLLKLAQFMGRQ